MNPFETLGLPATGSLADVDVRDAWRGIAAATHPDQDGGGDSAAYAAAAAAYAQLRTAWGRGEALADLTAQASPGTSRPRQDADQPRPAAAGTGGHGLRRQRRLPASTGKSTAGPRAGGPGPGTPAR